MEPWTIAWGLPWGMPIELPLVAIWVVLIALNGGLFGWAGWYALENLEPDVRKTTTNIF